MKWRPITAQSVASACGTYRVSKTMHSGTPLYTLWSGEKQVGMYDSMNAVNAAVANIKAKGAAQ